VTTAPTPLLDGASQPAPASETVTLLVVRPPPTADADAVREQLLAGLPPGSRIDAVQVEASEAARLLGGE
jgi:hypothetical protein